MRRGLVVVLLASACGRVGFGEHAASSDAGGGGGGGGAVDAADDADGDASPDAAESTQWRTTTPLPTKRDFGCAVATDDHVYFLGGGNDADLYADVLVASIGAAGTLGAWTQTTPLPVTTDWHACALDPATNKLYVIGGNNGTTARATGYVAQIAPDGSVGAWSSLPDMPAPRRGLGAAVSNGVLYAIGGESADNFMEHADVFALVLSNTAVGWGSAAALPTANYEFGTAVVGDRLYLTGGYDTTQAVTWAGAGSAFTATTQLPAPRQRHASAAVGNAVYVIGGEPDFNSTTAYSDAIRATVAADGSLGAWETLPALPGELLYNAATSANGRVYTLGGSSKQDYVPTVLVLSPP